MKSLFLWVVWMIFLVLVSDAAPSGIVPSGILPSGIVPSGTFPSGVFPSGIVPSGIVRNSFGRSSQKRVFDYTGTAFWAENNLSPLLPPSPVQVFEVETPVDPISVNTIPVNSILVNPVNRQKSPELNRRRMADEYFARNPHRRYGGPITLW